MADSVKDVRDLSDDGHVEAQTCQRHIIKWQIIVYC